MAGNGVGDFEFIIVRHLTTLIFNEKDDEILFDYTRAWLRAILNTPKTEHYDKIMASFIYLAYKKTTAINGDSHADLLVRCINRFKNISKRDIIKTKKYYERYYYTRN